MKDALDALLDKVRAESSRKRVKGMPDKHNREEQIKESFHSIYANPENWTAGRAIALIHVAESGAHTLLGAFREFTHKRTSARKLCRTAEPLAVEGEQFVRGDWWLHAHAQPEWPSNPEGIEHRELWPFDLELAELQVFAKGAHIHVTLKNGWICRVKLADQTQFVCPTNKIFMFFPTGTDVLEGMSFENKMSLRTRLGI